MLFLSFNLSLFVVDKEKRAFRQGKEGLRQKTSVCQWLPISQHEGKFCMSSSEPAPDGKDSVGSDDLWEARHRKNGLLRMRA